MKKRRSSTKVADAINARKAATKTKPKPNGESAEHIKDTIQDGDEKRDAVWFDDLVLCIYGPIGFITNKALIQKSVLSKTISAALSFMFSISEHVPFLFNGKDHKVWSTMRKELCRSIIEAHTGSFATIEGGEDNPFSPDEVAKALCDVLGEENNEASTASVRVKQSADEKLVMRFLEEPGLIMGLQQWVTQNPLLKPVKFHPSFLQVTSDALDECMSKFTHINKVPDLLDVVPIVISKVNEAIDDRWVQLVCVLPSLRMSMLDSLAVETITAVFPNHEAKASFIKMRTCYILESIMLLTSGPSKVSVDDHGGGHHHDLPAHRRHCRG